VSSTQLKSQLEYQQKCFSNYSKFRPKPDKPPNSSSVFALNHLIQYGESACWGTSEERKKLQREALACELEFGQFQIMLTICPDSFANYRICQMSNINSKYFFDLSSTKLNENDETLINSIKLPTRVETTRHATNDPYSCAVYFDTIIKIIIKEVIGFDTVNQKANDLPGLFGFPIAFVVSTESQNSGNLHAHILINIHGLPRFAEEYDCLDNQMKGTIEEYESNIKLVNMPINITTKCTKCHGDMDEIELPAKAYHLQSRTSSEFSVLHCSTCNLNLTCTQLIRNAINNDSLVHHKIIDYLQCSSHPMDFPTSINDEASKNLSDLLLIIQTHSWRHCQSCLKKNTRISDGRCCRFLIPQLLDENRTMGNQYLNPFVLVIALSFKCNHDFKFLVQGDQGNMARYCLKYATKPQKDVEDILVQYMKAFHRALDRFEIPEIDTTLSEEDQAALLLNAATRRLTSVLHSMTRKQETPAPMACLYLHRGTVFYTSHKSINIYLNSILSTITRQKGEFVEAQFNLDNIGNMEYTNRIADYIHRPDILEEIDFYGFCKFFVVRKSNVMSINMYQFQPTYKRSSTHCICLVKNPVVLVLIGKRLPDINSDLTQEEINRYRDMMLILFFPFRCPSELTDEVYLRSVSKWTIETRPGFFMKMNDAYYKSLKKSKV